LYATTHGGFAALGPRQARGKAAVGGQKVVQSVRKAITPKGDGPATNW
jgi:hypothetical protein